MITLNASAQKFSKGNSKIANSPTPVHFSGYSSLAKGTIAELAGEVDKNPRFTDYAGNFCKAVRKMIQQKKVVVYEGENGLKYLCDPTDTEHAIVVHKNYITEAMGLPKRIIEKILAGRKPVN